MPKPVIDYQSWPEKEFLIKDLQLDPYNLRLPDKGLSTKEIIDYLFEHENLLSLLKDITAMGYMPIQVLIVCKEEGNYILEGNRRLAVCMLLNDPTLAPESYRNDVMSLKKAAVQKINSLKVLVAPTRSAAETIIAKIHAKSSGQTWSTICKNNFYFIKINEGLSVEEISTTYNFKEADVRKAPVAYEMYRIAKSISLPAEIQNIIKEPRKFPITTFARLFDSTPGKNFFDITSNADGKVKIANKDDFDKKMQIALTDIVEKRVNSRSLNTNREKIAYFNKISEQIGTTHKQSKFSKNISPAKPGKPTPVETPPPTVNPGNPSSPVVPPKPIPYFPDGAERPFRYTNSAEAERTLDFLLQRFPQLALKLQQRPQRRRPLSIEDEYDVQYLIHGLLGMAFDDVRPEENTQSLAGKSDRMDFLIYNEEIAVETKMTRDGLADRQIAEQLILDIAWYQRHSRVKTIYCFVYDPHRRIRNEGSLYNDLNSKPGRRPKVKLIIKH